MHALDFGVNWDEGLQTDLGLCTWRQLTSGTDTLEQLRRSQWDIGLFPPLAEVVLVAPAVVQVPAVREACTREFSVPTPPAIH